MKAMSLDELVKSASVYIKVAKELHFNSMHQWWETTTDYEYWNSVGKRIGWGRAESAWLDALLDVFNVDIPAKLQEVEDWGVYPSTYTGGFSCHEYNICFNVWGDKLTENPPQHAQLDGIGTKCLKVYLGLRSGQFGAEWHGRFYPPTFPHCSIEEIEQSEGSVIIWRKTFDSLIKGLSK